jgi:glycogen synthase
MKIALLSYEYPPDTAIGGIATYVHQLAKILNQCGNYVEVFAGSRDRNGMFSEDGLVVHRVAETCLLNFTERIGILFRDRHQMIQFDVLEAPEFSAHSRVAVQQVPNIPLVIKLHTPGFLIGELNHIEPTISAKLRWYLGAIRRGRFPKPLAPRLVYDRHLDPEWQQLLTADEITTPSLALGNKAIDSWKLQPHQISHIPNPYIPAPELLNIPVNTTTKVITFLGRLEARKGILELAKAIPTILHQCPTAKFRFVGAPHASPQPGLDTEQYLKRQLRQYAQSLEFTGSIPLDQIPSVLAQTDICVFPSRWENFPNVCLEAMAAARGIVGSSAGGMFEMLEGGRVGRVVPPRDPKKIAESIIELLDNPELRMDLGHMARDRVLTEYNQERIGALQEESYRRAIARRKLAGPRIATSTSHDFVHP